MDIYNTITIIIVLTAVFSYLNFRFFKFPGIIGVMVLSLLASLLIIGIGELNPRFFVSVTAEIKKIDFHTTLMKIMLSFLLFAGAINIDARKLKTQLLPVSIFSTIGVLISTFIIGWLLYLFTKLLAMPINLIYCLMFGALISPTDPIAVLSILKHAKIPSSLETKITGESLFNDGIAVVLFATIYEIATIGPETISTFQVGYLFVREAGGGILLGFLLGHLGFIALKSIDNYKIEVLITLAIVMGGYLLAGKLQVSGPLSMVIAGIVTGNKSREEGMSDVTRDYVDKFWEMIDELMNAILFLLIGFEMLIIPFNPTLLLLGCITILIALGARFISVVIPIFLLQYKNTFEKNAIPILTWGGLRGGLSVAMALSIPNDMHGETFVGITYMVVLFSIIVQGLTIGKLANRIA